MNSEISNNLQKSSDGDVKSHQAFAMELSRLRKAKDKCNKNKDCSEFNRLGGEKKYKEIEKLVELEKEKNYRYKKVGMDAGRENQFIKNHDKDKDNSNPTAVGGVPKINKGSINDKIINNAEVYNEHFSKEINKIRYLIEYINNTKQNL